MLRQNEIDVIFDLIPAHFAVNLYALFRKGRVSKNTCPF